MYDSTIVIRQAQASDITAIWKLTHADDKTISIEEINNLIQQIYVLTYQKRILSVLCGNLTAGMEKIHWIATHPMYPEKQLQQAILHSLAGAICRKQLLP